MFVAFVQMPRPTEGVSHSNRVYFRLACPVTHCYTGAAHLQTVVTAAMPVQSPGEFPRPFVENQGHASGLARNAAGGRLGGGWQARPELLFTGEVQPI